MAVVVKAYAFDGMQGCSLEFGTLTLDPASIADNAVLETDIALAGADTGDLIFLNAVNLDTGLTLQGARITAAANLKLKLANESGGAVDGGSVVYQYMLVKIAA
jgi:hypothetical protein